MTNERAFQAISSVLAANQPLDRAGVIALGSLAREAARDVEDDAAALRVAAAEALLAEARGRLIAPSSVGPIEAPLTLALLRDPRGPFTAALAELDELGALTAGLSMLADSEGGAASLALVRSLAERVADVAKTSSGALFPAAERACALIAEHGAESEADSALMALAEVVDVRLRAALAGEPLEPRVPLRSRALDPGLAERLGAALAKALQKPSFDVSPDLLGLAESLVHAPASAAELVLHDATPVEETHALELLRGVWVRVRGGDVEVELPGPSEAVLLVAIERGEPGRLCPVRGGARANEHVFSLFERGSNVDGYALVVGDRLAFLRVERLARFRTVSSRSASPLRVLDCRLSPTTGARSLPPHQPTPATSAR